MSFYRNKENYSDPTAGAALSRIAREERRMREKRRKHRKLRTLVWKEKSYEYRSVSKTR
jgi:hypothetical protein